LPDRLKDARRRFSPLLVVSLLLTAGTAAAQPARLCVTDLGWCQPATDAAALGDACSCTAADTTQAGRILTVETPNPFVELETPAAATATRALPTIVSATRGFAGPSQLPPVEFSAYGILAFKRRASSFDRERHLMICEAYLSALPHSSEISDDPSGQMITIWPIETDAMADRLNAAAREATCAEAVTNYGLVQAQNAIRILGSYRAAEGRYDLSERGPFLIAWAPTSKILEEGSAALVVDLSAADTYEDVVHWLDLWRDKIQDSPETWQGAENLGPKWEVFVGILRDFFDDNGTLVRFGD
jgi:hypothetical protein